MERIISPSMLSADFGHLDRDTRMIDESAAQWIHIDVMDGVFVPNISFGFPVMKPIRRASAKFRDTFDDSGAEKHQARLPRREPTS